jgi:predicted RNA-binding protein with PUA-like domain
MAHWLVKTEPESYSWDELVARGAKGDAWTGVRNHIAKKHLQAMRNGDHVFVYHTGDEKRVVGTAEVTREAYPDPTDEKKMFVCVDIRAGKPLPRPVTLAEIKADAKLADMVLVRQARLSVQPVTEAEWKHVMEMGKK